VQLLAEESREAFYGASAYRGKRVPFDYLRQERILVGVAAPSTWEAHGLGHKWKRFDKTTE